MTTAEIIAELRKMQKQIADRDQGATQAVYDVLRSHDQFFAEAADRLELLSNTLLGICTSF